MIRRKRRHRPAPQTGVFTVDECVACRLAEALRADAAAEGRECPADALLDTHTGGDE